MSPILLFSLFVIGCYLVGSIPFGYLIAKSKGIDIRTIGSGNIGATNVGRALGKRWKIITILLDALKGASPIIVSKLIFTNETIYDHLAPFAGAMAAICGHNWTIFLGFKGGKGVATSAGVITFLSPYAALVAFVFYLAITRITKYVSVGSMSASCAMAATMILVHQEDPASIYYTSFGILIAVLVIARHHSNIRKLLKGEENRIDQKT